MNLQERLMSLLDKNRTMEKKKSDLLAPELSLPKMLTTQKYFVKGFVFHQLISKIYDSQLFALYITLPHSDYWDYSSPSTLGVVSSAYKFAYDRSGK